MSDEAEENTHPLAAHDGSAHARWQDTRTIFQRVYDIIIGTTDFTTAETIGARANCSIDDVRVALLQLIEMGVVERRSTSPTEYRRNESYFRWKRIETLAYQHSLAELREQVDTRLEEYWTFQAQFDAPDPEAISPVLFETVDPEQWEALARWRSVREELQILQQAIHRVEQNSEQ